MALTYGEIDAHVRDKYIPIMMDQFYFSTPLKTLLMDKARVVYDSGRSIMQPVLYGEENSGWYSGLDPFNIARKETTTLAEFEWKLHYVNVTIDGETELKVEGDEKILSLVETKMDNAGKTFSKKFNEALYVDAGAKAILTLEDAIGTTGTYGGIDRATETWWQGNVDTTGGAFDMDMLMDIYGDCSDGPIQPDLIVTTQDIYNKIWLRVQPQQRGNLENTPALAKVGFTGIHFNKATIVVDKYCPDGHIYVLNTDFWKLVVHRKRNMKWTDPKVPVDQDAYVRQVLWAGAILCQAPRWNGRISNVS
jgi:hypothetical protein